MLRFFCILIFLLSVSNVRGDPPITEERVLSGPLAEKLDPVKVQRPIPPRQWNADAKLWLARSCVGEAGFASYDECIGIAWVYATRAKETNHSLLGMIKRYSSAVKDRSTRKRSWILYLNLEGTKPNGWPKHLSWKKHKVLWFRLLKVLDDWEKGYYPNPVEGANHYGGPMDTPGKKWTRIYPKPGWLYRNSFYSDNQKSLL